MHAASHGPVAGGWIVELTTGRITSRVATHDQDPAIGKQGSGMVSMSFIEITGTRPNAASRVVELRACEKKTVGAVAAGDEHFAVGEQCRGVMGALSNEVTTRGPS